MRYPFIMDIKNNNLPYAVLRVDKRKAKALAAIGALSAHQMRQRYTPNADPSGPSPIMVFSAFGDTPYKAVLSLLDGAERRNKDTVLCREIVISASPSYFRPGHEELGGSFDRNRMQEWTRLALLWARKQFPDQLASFCLHLDEQTVHAHLMVVPRVKKTDGGWKLNSKALFDRERLRDLQTSYGNAMSPLGIRRGEPGSTATHSKVRQFYGAVKRAENNALRPVAPLPPKLITRPKLVNCILDPVATAFGVLTQRQKQINLYEMRHQKWIEEMKQFQIEESVRWEQMVAAAMLSPLRSRHRSYKVSKSTQNAVSSARAARKKRRP